MFLIALLTAKGRTKKMIMPSVEPTPKCAFFIYREDDTDKWAVSWRGNEWGTDNHADLRFWHHEPLNEESYLYLLNHYGLQTAYSEFVFEKVRKMSPEDLIAARRKLEKDLKLPEKNFTEGVDF